MTQPRSGDPRPWPGGLAGPGAMARPGPVELDQRPVLYAMACGSPVAGYLERLIRPALRTGWQVWVVTTPDGRKFVDMPALARLTSHPVRSEFRNPGDPDVMPPADAIVVAPATVNTVNKWACGIADTLLLGLLVEGYGRGVPMVVMPYTNTAMAAHPAFLESLRRLRSWGVKVLFGEHVMAMPPPGDGANRAAGFPWELALTALGPARPMVPQPAGHTARHPHPEARARSAPPAGNRVRLAPPTAPRPAPAILRPR